jgi:hypothetical protein
MCTIAGGLVPLGCPTFQHLEQLKEDGANIVPMVNQIEGSVTLQNPNIVKYCLITISFPSLLAT